MKVIRATPVTPYVSNPSAVGPTESPALSPGAIGNNTRIAWIIFLDIENDLHQVGTNVGDFGEDPARNPQSRSSQRFAQGKAKESNSP